jgi:hypothetical protein
MEIGKPPSISSWTHQLELCSRWIEFIADETKKCGDKLDEAEKEHLANLAHTLRCRAQSLAHFFDPTFPSVLESLGLNGADK